MSGFKLNPYLVARLKVSPLVRAVRHHAAEEVAEQTRENAPEFAGHYRENIEVEDTVADNEPASRVIANDPTGAASLIEWGSINNPAFAPLRRAVDAVLGNLKEAR